MVEWSRAPDFKLQSGVGNRNGFFVALPVYRLGQPSATVQERRDNLIGYVQGVFQTSVLIDAILRRSTAPAGLDLYWFAANSTHDAAPLYFRPSRLRKAPIEPQPRALLTAGLHWSNEINVGDRSWILVATPIPAGPGTASRLGSWMTLIVGLLLSALVTLYIWASRSHAERMRAANRNLDSANARLGTQNARFAAALGNVSQAIMLFDAAGRLLMTNQRYCEMYGLPPDVDQPGCTVRDLLGHRRRRGMLSDDPETYCENLLSTIAEGRTFHQFAELPDGRTIAIMNHPMKGGGWVTTHEDITERRRAEAKIAYMARHDALTDLPNRMLFHEQLEQALAAYGAGEGPRRALPRPRPLQGRERHARPSRRRPSSEGGRRALAGMRSRHRRGRPASAATSSPSCKRARLSRPMRRRWRHGIIETVGAPFELDGHESSSG